MPAAAASGRRATTTATVSRQPDRPSRDGCAPPTGARLAGPRRPATGPGRRAVRWGRPARPGCQAADRRLTGRAPPAHRRPTTPSPAGRGRAPRSRPARSSPPARAAPAGRPPHRPGRGPHRPAAHQPDPLRQPVPVEHASQRLDVRRVSVERPGAGRRSRRARRARPGPRAGRPVPSAGHRRRRTAARRRPRCRSRARPPAHPAPRPAPTPPAGRAAPRGSVRSRRWWRRPAGPARSTSPGGPPGGPGMCTQDTTRSRAA